MPGFFSTKELKSTTRPDGKTYSCASCGLYNSEIHNPRMKPYGDSKQGILTIGESPEELDDRKGIPWQGEAGRLLRKTYKELGINIYKDCISINAVNCRPISKKKTNRAPTAYEIACCKRTINSAIATHKPKVIIALGSAALESVLGGRWKKGLGNISGWRGWTIPDRDHNAWICPTFHPGYVRKMKDYAEISTIWKQDLRQAFNMVDVPLPSYTDEEKCIEIVKEKDTVDVLLRIEKELMDKLRKKERAVLVFDLETTGLKPYNSEKHDIACISLCTNPNKAYVIRPPKDRRGKALFKLLMQNQYIGKIAANMKFEDTWLKIMYDIEVFPWMFDTMLASHILDNRPGICGLKFQSFVQFGLIGYEEGVGRYLQSDPKDSNSVNAIMKAMEDRALRKEIMIYCGIDSLMTYRLAMQQMKKMEEME